MMTTNDSGSLTPGAHESIHVGGRVVGRAGGHVGRRVGSIALVAVAGIAAVAWLGADPLAQASQASPSAGQSRWGQLASTPASLDAHAMGELGQSRVVPYPMEQVWPTAVRYLRVDRGYTIVERDPDAGFILFDFPIGPEDRTGRGSVELFATKDASGRPSASVNVTTDGGPLHLPHAILEGLADKLRRERGQPGAPPRSDPSPPDAPPKDKPGDKPKAKDPEPPIDDGLIVDG